MDETLRRLAAQTVAFSTRAPTPIATVGVLKRGSKLSQAKTDHFKELLANKTVVMKMVRPPVKKDMLWRPLLREFRRYVRAKTLETLPLKALKAMSFVQQRNFFSQELSVPEVLRAQPHTALALILIVSSDQDLKSECLAGNPQQHLLHESYVKVFKTTSQR